MLDDEELSARLLALLRHPDTAMAAQGAELLQALPPELRHGLLRGRDLQQVHLEGADLSGMDLRDADLSHARLEGCRLIGACLDGARLHGTHLHDADLSGASVQMACLQQVRLHRTRLHDTRLTGSQLFRAELIGVSFADTDLTRADLRGAILSEVQQEGDCRLDDVLILAERHWDMPLPASAIVLDEETSLAGMDLSHRRLGLLRGSDQDLTALNLQGTRIDHVELVRARLHRACLHGARLHKALLTDADLTGADLRDAHLEAARLHGVRLEGADLRGACLDRADLTGVPLEDLDLTQVSLRDCVLRGRRLPRRLRGADLTGALLKEADLTGADLREARLEDTVLSEAILTGADLRGAHMAEAHLKGADLCGAVLSGADLRGAGLTGAALRDADLSGADLRGGMLREADLTGADLRAADLRDTGLQDARLVQARLGGAVLGRTGLQGADLTEAVGLSTVVGAVVDARTRLPDGVSRDGAVWLGPGANLRGADLRGVWMLAADLSGAGLAGADLREATLSRADLCGADLTGAQMEGTRLGQSLSSHTTRWPAALPIHARPAMLSLVQPQPLVPPLEMIARRRLGDPSPALARTARRVLARLGHGAEMLGLARAAHAHLDEQLMLAAHCPPDAIPTDAAALLHLMAETAQRPPADLLRALLHPEQEEGTEHAQVRRVHRILLGELRDPVRAEVVAGLRAKVSLATLGGRALRRLRVIDGLRTMAPEALEAMVLAGLRDGAPDKRRALARILRQTPLAGDTDLLFIASVEDSAVRHALLDRRGDAAATTAWIRQRVHDPTLDRTLCTNLVLRLPQTPETRAQVLQLAHRDLWLLHLLPAPETTPEPALVALLRDHLQRPDASTRYLAIQLVGPVVLRHASARDALLPVLREAWMVSQKTIWRGSLELLLRALQQLVPELEPSFAAMGVTPPPWHEQQKLQVLIQLRALPVTAPPPPEILAENLLEILAEASPARHAAVRWSVRHPVQAAAVLRAGLAVPQHRALCLQHLLRLSRCQSGLIPTDAVVPLLRTTHRRLAAELLGVLGDPAALEPLCQLAAQGDRRNQALVLRACAQILLSQPPPEPVSPR